MTLKIYNNGDFERLYRYLEDRLTDKNLFVTSPTALMKKGKFNGLYFYIGKKLENNLLDLEPAKIILEKKGWLFKKTDISAEGEISEDIERIILTALTDLTAINYII